MAVVTSVTKACGLWPRIAQTSTTWILALQAAQRKGIQAKNPVHEILTSLIIVTVRPLEFAMTLLTPSIQDLLTRN